MAGNQGGLSLPFAIRPDGRHEPFHDTPHVGFQSQITEMTAAESDPLGDALVSMRELHA